MTATQNIRASEAQGTYSGEKVKIVAVSANARQLYADLSAEAGMDGLVISGVETTCFHSSLFFHSFLRKPYSKAELGEVVKRFVEQE